MYIETVADFIDNCTSPESLNLTFFDVRNEEPIDNPYNSNGMLKGYILKAEIESFDAPEGDSICLNIDTHFDSL